jgi:hypothetical protein
MEKIIIRKDEGFAYGYEMGYELSDEDLISVIRFTEFEAGRTEVKFYLDERYVGRMRAKQIEVRD